MKIVIALGGNALLKKGDKQNISTQLSNARKALKSLLPIMKKNKTVITHGNGPQVGNILIRVARSKGRAYPIPLDVAVAESEGELGYIIEQSLLNLEPRVNAVSILTQVQVDKKDKAFNDPAKPVGPFFRQKKKGMKEDAGKGYRLVVPSPEPLRIIECNSIKKLLDSGFIVIAAGGGGIPVIKVKEGFKGIEAVIDKDKASSCLANDIDADTLLILTDVPCAYTDFRGKKRPIRSISANEAEHLLDQGEFAEGSMKPKIEAAIKFLNKKGRTAIITNPSKALEALRGGAGTTIR